PFMRADAASRRLRMVDLAAVIGAAPQRASGPMSPTQQAVSAKLRAEHRIIPDTPLDMHRMRAMDARITYRAASVEGGMLPIRTLSMKVDLDHGVLKVDPIAASLPQGQIAGLIRIDARKEVAATNIDLRLTGAQLA